MEEPVTMFPFCSAFRKSLKGAVLAAFLTSASVCLAADNVWTNSAGGNWEDPYWSLGILPGTNQLILFTNDGSKTLTIGQRTANEFPESLRVGAVLLDAVAGSTNTLRLDRVGLENPLTGSFFSVGSNTVLTMHSSALRGGTVYVGGTLAASDSTIDLASFWIGNTGPAVVTVTNSTIITRNQWEYLGSVYPAVLQQFGGTNFGSVEIHSGSEYRLFDGSITRGDGPSAIVLHGGKFSQFGGNANVTLWFIDRDAEYHLAGGVLTCGELDVPSRPVTSWGGAFGNRFRQTGGTNVTRVINLGHTGVPGSYSLEGGVLQTSNLIVKADFDRGAIFASTFYQSGGYHTNREIYVQGGYDAYTGWAKLSHYFLSNGILASASITLGNGALLQSGGTNQTANVLIRGVSRCLLSAGWLTAQNITLSGGYGYYGQVNTLQQSGGTNHVSEDLSLAVLSTYALSGGELFARNISLSQSAFYHTGGVVHVPGCLTLIGGTWDEQTARQQFGVLQLATEQWVGSNSLLRLSHGACVIRFSDSSSLTWSNSAVLTITNWFGSLYGDGSHQIVFGTNSTALTPQQLSQIEFENPTGLSPGTYPAGMLATGEIVPETGSALPPEITLLSSLPANGAVRLRIQGGIGQRYGIESSSNLLHWMMWTSQVNLSGSMVFDDDATNFQQRFYRARLIPPE